MECWPASACVHSSRWHLWPYVSTANSAIVENEPPRSSCAQVPSLTGKFNIFPNHCKNLEQESLQRTEFDQGRMNTVSRLSNLLLGWRYSRRGRKWIDGTGWSSSCIARKYIITRTCHQHGDVAHMVERSLSMREVLGSMPNFSSSLFFLLLSSCASMHSCRSVCEVLFLSFIKLTAKRTKSKWQRKRERRSLVLSLFK